MDKIYVMHNMQRLGPLTLAQVHQMLRNGELTSEDYVWWKGEKEWQKISVLPPETRFSAETSEAEKNSSSENNNNADDKLPLYAIHPWDSFCIGWKGVFGGIRWSGANLLAALILLSLTPVISALRLPIVVLLIQPIIGGVYLWLMVQNLRGTHISVGELLNKTINSITRMIPFAIISELPLFMLLLVPGESDFYMVLLFLLLIWQILLFFAVPLMLDGGLGVFNAIIISTKIARHYFFRILAIYLLFGLSMVLGLLTFGVLSILTVFAFYITQAFVYLQTLGGFVDKLYQYAEKSERE